VADITCFPGCICSDCTGHAVPARDARVIIDAYRRRRLLPPPSGSELPERASVIGFSPEVRRGK
jgi:hypothetical protein